MIPPVDVQEFLTKLDAVNPNAAILSIFQPFADQRKSQAAENLPSLLSDVFKEEYQNYSLEQLKQIKVDVTISGAEKDAVARLTKDQSKSKQCFKYRAGRVTASKFRQICKTSIDKPSLSLLKSICYPNVQPSNFKATTYGI